MSGVSPLVPPKAVQVSRVRCQVASTTKQHIMIIKGFDHRERLKAGSIIFQS